LFPRVPGRCWPQEAIVAIRTGRDLARRSKRRIVDDALDAHFVTFSVFRRSRLLDHAHPQRIVLGVLNSLLIEGDARCIGFVVMLDHFHALLWFPQTGKLSGFMQEWKRQSSLNIRQWFRESAATYSALSLLVPAKVLACSAKMLFSTEDSS
jgi:REP element-mobilizing transposase RayT